MIQFLGESPLPNGSGEAFWTMAASIQKLSIVNAYERGKAIDTVKESLKRLKDKLS